MLLTNDGDRVLAEAVFFRMWVRRIQRGWLHLYQEEMKLGGDSSNAQFQSCKVQLREKFLIPGEEKRWANYLDLANIGEIEAQPSAIGSVDDIAPNMFKNAVYEIAYDLGSPDHRTELKMTDFLRRVLKHIFRQNGFKGRLNVGANRHFPRLFQWLAEVQEETNWVGGQGLRIMNIGGAGAVATNPYDPAKLKVVIKREWL